MKSRRPVNSDVILLPFDEICGSRLNYKLAHASIRVACLVGIAVVFVVTFAGRFDRVLEQFTIYLFLGLPLIVLSVAIFESVWFRRTEPEQRAVAIDWLFVVAYLVVWAFEMVRVILAGLMVSLWV
jgi:ABC-type dipeptide/oligopeptide/nickel transport system permease subunit